MTKTTAIAAKDSDSDSDSSSSDSDSDDDDYNENSVLGKRTFPKAFASPEQDITALWGQMNSNK